MNIQIHSEYDDGSVCYSHATKTKQNTDDYFLHYHDAAELIFIKSGDISYQINQRKYPVGKNTLIFSRAFEQHGIVVDGESEYERYDILFDEKMLPAELFDRIPRELDVINFDTNKSVIQIFDKMEFYCKELSGEDFRRVLMHLIEEVLLNMIIELDASNIRTGLGGNPIVDEAAAYIEKNLLSITGIEEICSELFISKSHLHHLFMEHMKMSPKKYILQKRLAIAHREICLGEKATLVYEKCGFTDYSAFYRAYKKHFGYSPIETPHAQSVRISFADVVRGYQA
ncbi:MAG: helix-turn-helix transcriptional regulator [Oscillospiraceae bacterium]|nr:helix-turn-helix transcriptional regulator [Oscillospiraceae bacterium]